MALARLSPDASVRRFFVHFPDPWWKKRHAKRLVVRDTFLAEVARLLEPGGELFVQTDVEERARAYEDLVSLDPRFVPAGDEAVFAATRRQPVRREEPAGAKGDCRRSAGVASEVAAGG